ncbi:MAG: hypothetical protein V8R99_00265 [Eubacterium ventriosum]|uniref:hypothetical protein n=1 Tax=Eubacterium ventriosum TaxID=39496 RepID=UPI00300E8E8E
MKPETINSGGESICHIRWNWISSLGMVERKSVDNINKLNKALLSEKKYEELKKSTSDEEYQKELLKKYKIMSKNKFRVLIKISKIRILIKKCILEVFYV